MMKKFALATLLALSTSAVFASNTGFQGQQLTVKQALSAQDGSVISLVGNITQQLDDDEYVFTDGSDQIKVDIRNRAWRGLNVGPQDKIRVYGRVDNDAFQRTEVEVFSVEKAQ